MVQEGDIEFSGVTTINLDEYKGLAHEHEQSYWHFMQVDFFEHINVRADRIFVPDGSDLNEEATCQKYDHIIKSVGRVDPQF